MGITMNQTILVERVERRILLIRGHKVLLDNDLAELYGVPAFRLNEQVKRNVKRFPTDFMFQLTAEETKSLRSQIAILKLGRGRHRKYLPYVFTEQGVAMLSSVLNSERAIQVNIIIMRAFVNLKQVLATHRNLARKLAGFTLKKGEEEMNTRQNTRQAPETSRIRSAPKPVGLSVKRINRMGGEGTLRAFCDLEIAGSFLVKGVRVVVVEGKNGLFVSMPHTTHRPAFVQRNTPTALGGGLKRLPGQVEV